MSEADDTRAREHDEWIAACREAVAERDAEHGQRLTAEAEALAYRLRSEQQAEENARLRADWEMYLSEPHDVFVALREERTRLRAALDILIAANEKHSDPRCGHCGYALADARAALRAPGQP